MSSSTRLSLSDCALAVQFPPLPSSPLDADAQTLHAATDLSPPLTETNIGATLFVLVTLTPPTPTATLSASLPALADVSVTLGPTRAAARLCPLPLLRESSWQLASPAHPAPAHPAPRLCKGLWVLVRTPPQTSHLIPPLPVSGPQHVYAHLTHRHPAHSARNSPVWATIDRASRLFAKPVALHASRPVLVNQPLEIACFHVPVPDETDTAFVCITAKNATADTLLSIVPPYINVNRSHVVVDPSLTSPAPGSRQELPAPVEIAMPLNDRYEFVPMFTSNDPADDDDDDLSAELSSYNAAQLWRGDSATTNSGDDYGLFIPSFNHRQQRAVPLGPREVFNFVYKVVQKGRNAAEPALLHKEAAAKENRSQPEETAFKLKHGTCLETSVAVAWNCVPKLSAIVAAPADADADADEAFHRELSSGGVLATGRRGNVAVRWTCVHWRPPALIEDVLVAFSGPPVCNVGDRLSVSVTILNQTADDLVSAAVCVQQEEDAQMDLLALRTVLVVGHIASGQETTVQIPCIAFRAGSLSLGPVQIMDRGNPEENRTVWTSQAAYAVFVVDPKALIPGDPQPPRPFVVQENETNMIAG